MGKRSSKNRQSKRGQARTRSRKYNARQRQQQRAAANGSSRNSSSASSNKRSSGRSSSGRRSHISNKSGKHSAKRRVSAKARRRRAVFFTLLLLIILVAACIFVFKKFDPNNTEPKKESKEKAKREKIHLPENERASYFAELLEDQDVNIIAGHPIDVDDALYEFLMKAYTESAGSQTASSENSQAGTQEASGNDTANENEAATSDHKLITLKTTGDYDQYTPGNYDVKVKIKDRSGDKKTVKLQLGVKDLNNEKEDYSFLTQKGFLAMHRNGITTIDGITIANKTFSVPKKYGKELTRAAFEAFEKMESDAADDGITLFIKSDYRPYKDQKLIYDEYRKKHGVEEADKYSARPGHSEHQIGEAIDINATDKSFADTPAGQWVNKNCSKYGYIIRYPEGKADESMYIYEPWHLRYVGKKLAKQLYNKGDWITLEDHFGIDSNYSE